MIKPLPRLTRFTRGRHSLRHLDRKRGYVLLPVMVAITLIAAIAFLLNSESAMELNQEISDLEATRVEYVAQAGMQHGIRETVQQGCGPYSNLSNVAFSNDQYSTILTTDLGTTTSYTLYVDQDTWIESDNPSINFGSASNLKVQTTGGVQRRSVYRYDLSGLPVGSSILSATAWFYLDIAHPLSHVNIHALGSDWNETNATWASLGDAMQAGIVASIPSQTTDDVWVKVNMTSQVQSWSNGQPNLGIVMDMPVQGGNGEYASRESANPPYLRVVVGQAPTPTATLQSDGTLASGVVRSILRKNLRLVQSPVNFSAQQVDAAVGIDTYLDESNPNNNNGTSTRLWVQEASGSDDDHILMKFVLGQIPFAARIENATLQLYQDSGATPGAEIGIYRVLREWEEGSQDYSSGTVNWNSATSSQGWSVPGGEFDHRAIDRTTVSPGVMAYYEWDVTELVQGWVNGVTINNGLILIAEATGTWATFSSSDHTIEVQRPKLTVTYSCDCGSLCLEPQGSGKIAMVVNYPSLAISAEDQAKKDRLESWGYTVDAHDDNFLWLLNTANYDALYISSTASDSVLVDQLKYEPIGIVYELAAQNNDLGIADADATAVGTAINITDTSHYITLPFAAGTLPIKTLASRLSTASGTVAAGAQVLANVAGSESLVAIESGAALGGIATGEYAAARRVMLPIGMTSTDDWSHLNQNGLLLVQRALQWGMGDTGLPQKNLLLVVADPGALSAQDAARKALIESWGYTVNLIDDNDTQAAFDAALTSNEVAYIPETINPANVGTKLTAATIGIVNEEKMLLVELGFSGDLDRNSINEIVILDNAHWITSGLALGTTTIVTSNQPLTFTNNGSAPGAQTLAETNQVSSFFEPSLLTLETNAALFGGGFAAGRRVSLPWGDSGFDINALNAAGKDIMRRAIEWGAGVGSPPPTANNVLMVVGSLTLSDKDAGYKALMESWGHTVSLIDDGDSQANYDTAMAAVDVVYASGSALGANMQDKATFTTKGIVNEVPGKIDNFGFSSIKSATTLANTLVESSATHYISSPFGGANIGVFSPELSMPVLSGTLAPDLDTVAKAGGYSALATLDTGATRYDSIPSQGRRVHLPYAAAKTSDLTADGKTVMRRAIEWAAGNGAISNAPIAHWKLDDGTGTTAIDSEGGHDGILSSAGPVWVAGHLGNALDFDGATDYVDLTSDAELDDLFVGGATVMAWIEPAGWGNNGYGRIFDKSSSPSATGNGWALRMSVDNGGIINFGQGFTGGRGWWAIPNGSISLGAWQHIAVAYDASTTANDPVIYLDGNPVAVTRVDAPSGDILSDAAINLHLGKHASSAATFFDGKIDDARIYDHMLTATDIADIAGGGGGGGGGGSPPPGSCDGTFRDEFNLRQYDQNDGSLTWATDWQETGEDQNPVSGDIYIGNDVSDYQLIVRDDGQTVWREADLDGAVSATLSFDYRRENLVGSNDYVAIEVSYDAGGNWTELDRFIGSADDGSYTTGASYPLDSLLLSANTRIRFRTPSSGMSNNNKVLFDNVQIQCSP